MTEVRELIHLGFQRYAPHPVLTPWVECYWTTHNVLSTPSKERLYPDGGSSLIFDFTGRNLDMATFAAHQSPQTITVTGPLFGIKFRPTGAYQLLGIPIKELAGNTVSQAQVLVPRLMELYERIMAKTFSHQITIADQWMLARANNASNFGTLGRILTTRITSQPCSKQQLLSELGVSRRTTERLLKEQTGNTFGQLQAWSRVKRARQSIRLGLADSLTEIGLTCGYYDQSHFIREFRKATSFTPLEYRRRQRMRIDNGEMALS